VTACGPESEKGTEAQRRRLGLSGQSADLGSRSILAQADEVYWYPSEVDVSIRPGWFYHPYEDTRVRSVENLVDIYFQSVGRNSVLLLNIPPDTRGLLHEVDVQRLADLRRYIDKTFDENLIKSKEWKAGNGVSKEFKVRKNEEFDTFLISEDISKGQRVEGFTVEVLTDGEWNKIAEGTTIGYKRLLRFQPVKADRIRVTITSTRNTANISSVGLFRTPGEGFQPSIL
jgi:alpha-L-fucosidase